MRLLLVAAAAVTLIAATPAEVAPELRTVGYFVDEGSAADPATVSAAVSDARNAGGALNVVVLAEEPGGGATTFSDAVLDELGTGTVLTVAPETVGFASQGDVWTLDELEEAVDASLDAGSDTEVVERFVATLIGQPVGGEEPASSGGGLLWWLLIVALGVAALVGFFVWRASSREKAAGAKRLADVRSQAEAKLDDIANDIIDLEDEVATAGNAEAQGRYQRAAATYEEAVGAAERAQTPAELLALSTKLDEAIWELDCAEAILDGKPLPPKPEPPAPPTEAAPAPPRERPIPGTDYVRRTGRRSTPIGSDITQTLLTMMAMGAMSGGRRSSPFGGLRGGTTASSSRRSSTRVRGGGRRRRG